MKGGELSNTFPVCTYSGTTKVGERYVRGALTHNTGTERKDRAD
jgi:hypothetical protein